MTADDKIRDLKCSMILTEKQQKISALSSRKLDKYQYLTGEETLPSNQRKKQQNKLSLHVLLQEKLEKNKQND